jgi:hypothetical protein
MLSSREHESDGLIQNLLPSVNEYAGFVDANALCYLWLSEFNPYRFTFISGSLQNPIFSSFSLKGADPRTLRDVLIHCDGSHFTLLEHMDQRTADISRLLTDASRAGCVVQINDVQVQTTPQPSLTSILGSLRS